MSQPDTTIEDIDQLVEKLADIEHQRWADWQEWVHTLYRNNREIFDTYIERWEKQIATPFSELSEREKQSDRDQVDRYLPILESYINNKVKEARIDENQRWADGYASALYDHPDIDDPQSLQAAKLDFEDRIRELKSALRN